MWRVCLALTLYHCINSAYGEQGWTGEGRNAATIYHAEWEEFKQDILRAKIKLALPVAKTTPVPTVVNFDLRSSEHSQFGLDGPGRPAFPLKNEDD